MTVETLAQGQKQNQSQKAVSQATSPPYLWHIDYTDFWEFCWARATPSGCVAFSPDPRCSRHVSPPKRPCPRLAALCWSASAIRPCGRRTSGRPRGLGWVRPGGEPGSVGRRGSCPSPNLSLSAPLLGLLPLLSHRHSSAPQKERTRRWCRTSSLQMSEEHLMLAGTVRLWTNSCFVSQDRHRKKFLSTWLASRKVLLGKYRTVLETKNLNYLQKNDSQKKGWLFSSFAVSMLRFHQKKILHWTSARSRHAHRLIRQSCCPAREERGPAASFSLLNSSHPGSCFPHNASLISPISSQCFVSSLQSSCSPTTFHLSGMRWWIIMVPLVYRVPPPATSLPPNPSDSFWILGFI